MAGGRSSAKDSSSSTMAHAAAIELRLLGRLQLLVGGEEVSPGGDVRRTILGLLALRAGESVSSETIAEAAWGENAVDRERRTIQVHMHNLRQRLGANGAQALRTVGRGYLLDPDVVDLDLWDWEAMVSTARRAEDAGHHTEAAQGYRAALALARGPLLADLEGAAFEPERATWIEEVVAVRERWLDAELATGQHSALVGTLTRLVEEHPERERFWEQLMLALYRSGRQAEALEAYQSARTLLAEQTGLDPGPGLRALESEILLQSARLDLVESGPAVHWLVPDGRSQSVRLGSKPITVGRSKDNDVPIDWDEFASRRHAHLEPLNDSWVVVDDGSVNGTHVNGQIVTGPTVIGNGDLVRCGETVLLIVTQDEDGVAARKLSFDDRTRRRPL